jgi:outer membrane murein-binding lipoprotein Lpp
MNHDELVGNVQTLIARVEVLNQRIKHFDRTCNGCRGTTTTKLSGIEDQIRDLHARVTAVAIDVATMRGGQRVAVAVAGGVGAMIGSGLVGALIMLLGG